MSAMLPTNTLNNTASLSLPNAPYWHLPCDSTALEAVWCQLSAQASALEGKPKELVLSKGYDKILLSIPPGLLPPTAQPWLRKSSKTSEKCLHATDTLLLCTSGGDPGCPVNSPCKQTLTERTPWGWGQPQWGLGTATVGLGLHAPSQNPICQPENCTVHLCHPVLPPSSHWPLAGQSCVQLPMHRQGRVQGKLHSNSERFLRHVNSQKTLSEAQTPVSNQCPRYVDE